MTEIFRAEITLAPAETESGAAGLLGQRGGAAALLDVNVGANSGDNVSTALAILQSRQFINQFINEENLLIPLFASRWDKKTQCSVVDPKVYNQSAGGMVVRGCRAQ